MSVASDTQTLPTSPTSAPLVHPQPAECVIAGAFTLLHVTENGGDNRGEMIDLMLQDLALPPGTPWCAAYVRRVGHFALLDPITGVSGWPLPDTGSCQALAEFARQHDILFTTPMHGDVFLLWNDTLGAFHHTGFVLNVTETPTEWLCTTIEGNSNTDGSPHGYEVTLRTRAIPRLGATRFIDWQMLTNPVTFQ